MTIDILTRPAAGTPEGALILLHGRGADERDLHGLLDVFDPQRRLVGMTPGTRWAAWEHRSRRRSPPRTRS
jgi:predicted esterase